MVEAAPAFGITPSEKRTLDLITDHQMIPREHLATWLGVSEGRISQMMHNLVKTWGLIERHGKRGDVRYTLSAEGIRYVTHRDRAELPTTRGIWSTARTTDKEGRRRHVGHRIETWARQTKHADGITWFLSQLEAETREDSSSELQWSVPTARSDRAYNWGESAIAPDAVGHLLTPNPPMRSGLGVGTRGEGRGTRRSALDSDKWGRWRPLVVVGGADGGPGQRRWGGVGGTACRGRQSRTGPVRLCGSVG